MSKFIKYLILQLLIDRHQSVGMFMILLILYYQYYDIYSISNTFLDRHIAESIFSTKLNNYIMYNFKSAC